MPLPEEIKTLAKEKIEIFKKDNFDSRLKTHKLHGQFKEDWAFWIDRKYRIMFTFEPNNMIHFHSVGITGTPRDTYYSCVLFKILPFVNIMRVTESCRD